MPLIQLPSFNKSKDLKETINLLEKMRKELEYILSTLDIDNLNNNYVSVVESGSNSNGSYRKFSDGTMECWYQSKGLSSSYSWLTTTVGTETYYYNVYVWVFPASFKSGEVINLTASGDIYGAYPETHTAFNIDNTKCQCEAGILGGNPATLGGNVTRTWFARGKWK